MAISRFASLTILLLALPVFAQSAREVKQKEGAEAIKKFLASQKTETETAEPDDNTVADLNGDGKPEIVLVWILMGPTYFNSNLTVFSMKGGVYEPAATFPLTGEAKLSSVKNGIINVEQKVLAKKDPLCCPSITKHGKYRWMGNKILEVKK